LRIFTSPFKPLVLLFFSDKATTWSVITSFLAFSYGSLNLFFSSRIEEEKEEDPKWIFQLIVTPFVLTDTLSSAILISLGLAFSKFGGHTAIAVLFTITAILTIIIVNGLIFIQLLGYPEVSDTGPDTSEESHLKPTYKLKSDRRRKLHYSIGTSFMLSTLVVKSTVKVQPRSSFVAAAVYFWLHFIAITYQILMGRKIPEDFSIVVCLPRNFTSIEMYEEVPILYDHYTGLDVGSDHLVRICEEDESPYSVLTLYLIPLLLACPILKMLSAIALSQCSNYNNLVRICCNKTIYFMNIIDDPLKFKGDLLDFLHKNKTFINKQNPLTGKTILHRLQPEVMERLCQGKNLDPHDEFKKLYDAGECCIYPLWSPVEQSYPPQAHKARNWSNHNSLNHRYTKICYAESPFLPNFWFVKYPFLPNP